MFFHFQLNPIAEIKPWGKKDEPNLHWFGLSDGYYWIQIGETELFRYNQALLTAYPPQNPALASHPLRPYVDYFVVRLWEDILEIFPTILDPLPPSLLQRMQPIEKWLQFCQKAQVWREELMWNDNAEEIYSTETLEARWEIYNEALLWWWDRQLYTGPISSPEISFWSDGLSIHCLWDSRHPFHEDGLHTWESTYGTAIIPTTSFIEAVTSFNTRFISAMAQRVQTVLTNWSRPEIKLDLAQVAREQIQRSAHFAKRMAELPTRAKTATEWENILAALNTIEHDPGFLALPQIDEAV